MARKGSRGVPPPPPVGKKASRKQLYFERLTQLTAGVNGVPPSPKHRSRRFKHLKSGQRLHGYWSKKPDRTGFEIQHLWALERARRACPPERLALGRSEAYLEGDEQRLGGLWDR